MANATTARECRRTPPRASMVDASPFEPPRSSFGGTISCEGLDDRGREEVAWSGERDFQADEDTWSGGNDEGIGYIPAAQIHFDNLARNRRSEAVSSLADPGPPSSRCSDAKAHGHLCTASAIRVTTPEPTAKPASQSRGLIEKRGREIAEAQQSGTFDADETAFVDVVAIDEEEKASSDDGSSGEEKDKLDSEEESDEDEDESVDSKYSEDKANSIKAACYQKQSSPRGDRNDVRLWQQRKYVTWETRFEELRQYMAEHGHCKLSYKRSGKKQLATWVGHQRTQYRFRKLGKKSTLSDERLAALEGIGFRWRLKESIWEERLEELGKYKAEHGHCKVSSKSSDNKQLHSWVMNLRNGYRLWQQGKKSPITEDRIADLKRIGFVWDE